MIDDLIKFLEQNKELSRDVECKLDYEFPREYFLPHKNYGEVLVVPDPIVTLVAKVTFHPSLERPLVHD